MFTGIVEEIGEILNFHHQNDGAVVEISCKKVIENLNLGDSVCVSGVCLTATELTGRGFKADISGETLKRSWFSSLTRGTSVNLERSLMAGGRLGGHIVNGHVDCTGSVFEIPPSNSAGNWVFSLPEQISRYVVEKGSIAIDGISLTVANIWKDRFSVAIIPTTVSETSLITKRVGNTVNLEVDILAKYVEKLLENKGENSTGQESSESLAKKLNEYGYL